MILSVPFCPYHFVLEPFNLLTCSPWQKTGDWSVIIPISSNIDRT